MPIDASIPLGVQQFKFNNPFEQLGQIREQQQRRQLNDQAIRSNQALEEDRRNKIAREQRLAESTQVIDGLMDKAMVQDPDTGIFTFDRGLAEQSIVKANQGHRLPEYMQHFDELDKSTREAAEKRNAAIAKSLMVVTTAGNTPGSAQGMIAYLRKNRLMSDQEAQGVLASLAEDETPEHVAAIVKKYGEAIPQYRELLNAEETRKGVVAKSAADLKRTEADTAKTIAETGQIGLPKPVEPAKAGTFEDYVTRVAAERGKTPKQLSPYDIRKAKAEYEAAGRAPSTADQSKLWVVRDGKTIRISEGQYQPGDTPASTREQGRPVTAADASDLADFDTSLDELSAVRAAITPKDSTGIVARVGATLPYVTQLTGWGEDAKKRQAVIDRVKQVIGKTLEGGVLRKEDEAKYEKILPNIGDAPSVAASKLDGLDTAIKKRKQRRLDNLADANYDVSKQTQRGGGAPAPKPTSGPAVGATVTYAGKRYKVIGITNGQADLEPLP